MNIDAPRHAISILSGARWLPILLFFLTLALYLRTLAPGIFVSDFAEFQYQPARLGLPHPNGFPFYMMLGWLWSQLPIETVAWRMNALSAVGGALCVALTAAFALRLSQRISVALLAAGLLALSPTFWFYSLAAERYTLNLALLVAVFWTAWEAGQRQSSRPAYLSALLLGLGMATHPSDVLAAPLNDYAPDLAQRYSLTPWGQLVRIQLPGQRLGLKSGYQCVNRTGVQPNDRVHLVALQGRDKIALAMSRLWTLVPPRMPAWLRRHIGWLLVPLLVAPALWPLFQPGFFVSDDGMFHVYRTAALAEAWQHGVLWPRLFAEFGFGYGQAVLNFYAPLSYFPASFMSIVGMNPATAVQVVIALSFLLAAAAAFGYGNHLFGPAGGVLAAVVYTYTPYHLADAYVRGAVPEHMAFIFPPLILWAFTAAFRSRYGADGFRYGADAYSTRGYTTRSPLPAPRSPLPSLLWGSLAWAGLVLTHNLTALLMIPVAVAHLLVLAAWTRQWRRLLSAAGALALAVGLSAVFWLPALVESRAVGLSAGVSTGYTNHLLTGETLLRRSLAYFVNPPETLGPVFPLSWFALGLIALGLALLLLRAVQRQLPEGWPPLAFHLAVAVVAMFMTTTAALLIWQPLTPILGQLQYPWRFLLLEAVGLMGVAAALPALLPRVRPAWIVAATALLAMLVGLPGLRIEPLPLNRADAVLPDRMWAEDAAAGQVGATWTGEFLPKAVGEQRWALGRPREGAVDGAPMQPAPLVTLTKLGYTSLTARIESAAPMQLRLHQFHLPGWNAAVDGQPAATYPTDELGLVTVDVPAGTHEVVISFGATPARISGLVISLIAVAVWIALAFVRGRRRSLKVMSVVLGAFAVVLALNSLGVGQRTWTPQPAQATLEDVAVLLAADSAARPDLDLAEVTLYWLALRETGQDFKAFVHLLGPDGSVIAQHDGDPVGGFTPTTRWRPGEIVADRHVIPLPEGIPTGEYGLRAGLYQVDPLRNLVVDPPAADNRVDIGTLRVGER